METFFHVLYVILVSVALGAAILLASRTLYVYVRSQIVPGEAIVLGTFTSSGEGLPSDTKAVGSALGSRLERLKRVASHEQSRFGLVHSPILTPVPTMFTDRRSEARKNLENLNLKVKDVDVNALVSAVRSVFEPARPTLEGQVTLIGDRVEIRAELRWKGEIVAGWIASRLKSDKIAEALNDLYDDLLFQVLYDIPRNPKLHWFAGAMVADDIPNWQTLQAVTLGSEALQTYALTLEYADLQRAIRHLKRIQVHAPAYAEGHYFLAIALGEDRHEKDAASLLSHVQRMDCSQLLKWNAALQQAAAMLRQYKAGPAQEAVTEVLTPLITSLAEAADNADTKRTADEQASARRLLPMAYAQLAYTYGTLFTLNSTWLAADLRAKSLEASEKAFDRFNTIEKAWPSDSEREKKDVERWVHNARGYSRFRIAQFERKEALAAKRPAEEVDRNFREACDEALKDLDKANEIPPNNYQVLQNQAFILDDPDYDPKGARLHEAEALYGRTTLFVPRDYYQYERLSRIYWRRLKSTPPNPVQRELAKKGSEAVSLAVKYRYAEDRSPGQSMRIAALGAYFSAVEARLETDPAKKRQKLTESIGLAEFVQGLNPSETTTEMEDAAQALTAAADSMGDEEADKKVKENAAKASDGLKSHPKRLDSGRQGSGGDAAAKP